ncbi:unnamed protein product [Tilletia controversa]|nr:unnamed protein product [Tilletia controversa]
MSPSPPSAADIKIFTRHSLPFEIIHDSPTLLASCPNNTFSNLPVLLDPGATLNYIDPTLVQQLNLSTEEITQSFAVRYADGSNAKSRTSRTVTLTVCCSDYCFTDVKFFVTPLSTHQMFFGIPWFLRFGITLDFLQLRLSFNVHRTTTTQASDEIKVSDADKLSINASLASSSTGSMAPITSSASILPAPSPSSTLLQEHANDADHNLGTHFGALFIFDFRVSQPLRY